MDVSVRVPLQDVMKHVWPNHSKPLEDLSLRQVHGCKTRDSGGSHVHVSGPETPTDRPARVDPHYRNARVTRLRLLVKVLK